MVKNPPASAGDIRDMGLNPRSGRSPTEGHGNPLQYSRLNNPLDRETGRLQSIASQTVRHEWSDLALTQHRLHLYKISLPSSFSSSVSLVSIYFALWWVQTEKRFWELIDHDEICLFSFISDLKKDSLSLLCELTWLKLQGFKRRVFSSLFIFINVWLIYSAVNSYCTACC